MLGCPSPRRVMTISSCWLKTSENDRTMPRSGRLCEGRASVSADHHDWLTAAAKRSHKTTEASAVVIDTVARAEMDVRR